jgi:hypothetical protein
VYHQDAAEMSPPTTVTSILGTLVAEQPVPQIPRAPVHLSMIPPTVSSIGPGSPAPSLILRQVQREPTCIGMVQFRQPRVSSDTNNYRDYRGQLGVNRKESVALTAKRPTLNLLARPPPRYEISFRMKSLSLSRSLSRSLSLPGMAQKVGAKSWRTDSMIISPPQTQQAGGSSVSPLTQGAPSGISVVEGLR